jgi:hypothetical protein
VADAPLCRQGDLSKLSAALGEVARGDAIPLAEGVEGGERVVKALQVLWWKRVGRCGGVMFWK